MSHHPLSLRGVKSRSNLEGGESEIASLRSQRRQGAVVVAMSGGVDSSVAAALLKEEGYEVMGITMHLWHGNGRGSSYFAGDAEDARRVCHILGIPHQVVNLESQFQTCVIDPFLSEYAQGRTPNPCITCNEQIKFEFLLRRAILLGADYLATGHYTRLDRSGDEYRLLKGSDPASDQSYFLYGLRQEQLEHTLFPLGNYSKGEVRHMAVERGLPTADKMKSQDICFIPDGNHRAFLAAGISLRPGEILDTAGRVLGKHEGVAFYTVGQRHGLGLVSKERLYVTRIDSSTDTLVVGGEQELYSDCAFASSVKFVCGKPLCEPMTITAKIRYRSPGAEAVLCPRDESVAEIRFDYPQRAITPGQAVVFYKGDVVLGGGIIEDGTGSFYGAEYGAFR